MDRAMLDAMSPSPAWFPPLCGVPKKAMPNVDPQIVSWVLSLLAWTKAWNRVRIESGLTRSNIQLVNSLSLLQFLPGCGR